MNLKKGLAFVGVSMMIFSMSIPTFAKEISGEREEKQIVSMQQGSQVIGEETIRIFESDDMYQEKNSNCL